MTGPRDAMTFIEVAVGLAVVGLLAAVVVPEASGYFAARRARDTATILTSLQYSLTNHNVALGGLGFVNGASDGKDPNGRYPATLTQLLIPITQSDVDCSGTLYTKGKVSGWEVNGPFTGLLVTPGIGVNTPMGIVQDAVYNGSGTTAGLIELHMDSVATPNVENLDLLIDRRSDSTSGQVRYVQSTAGASRLDLHLVKFMLPRWQGC